jgi:hypothetical protein
MKCQGCGDERAPLFRASAKGGPPIWQCVKCLDQVKWPIDPTVRSIVETVDVDNRKDEK